MDVDTCAIVEVLLKLWKKSHGRGASEENAMDPGVWSDLQHHINLENVYLKLPMREFFQLRGVCKDWNRLACQRRCFTDPIHKPYFKVTYPVPGIPYHGGIVTFHIASGRWKWNSLHLVPHLQRNTLQYDLYDLHDLYEPFSVNGLAIGVVFEIEMEVRIRVFHWHQVYDAHTKTRCRIPKPPNMTGRPRAVGMAVDTCAVPYTFKLILSSVHCKTQIYDSVTNSWETRSSLLVPFVDRQPVCSKVCVHCDDHVYIWSHIYTILVYSLEEDTWSVINPPLRQENDQVEVALGSREGRVIAVMEDRGVFSISVWELEDRSKHLWRHFARISSMMQAWLVPQQYIQADSLARRLFASFCDEYVFMNTSLGENVGRGDLGGRNVLFNLASKHWEKMNIDLQS